MMTNPAQADPEERQTRAALDEAIRAHAATELDTDGEVIVAWIALAATRNVHGGGFVITMLHDRMPHWEAEGMLRRAVRNLDAVADVEED
jgi:hypothetical protein